MAPRQPEGSRTHVPDSRLSRRSVLATAGGGVAASLPGRALGAGTPEATPAVDWEAFDQAVAEAMATFDVVGAAVAVVTADGIAYSNTFGVADLDTSAAVTMDTHFLAASVTKSMTSLLVATFVDEGAFGWDDRVSDLWPDFRAPTAELTSTLRVRDLLGMVSGLGEPPAFTFHQGDPTAIDLARSLALLPVIGPTGGAFFYNNTVYALGGYLPALVQGTAEDDLAAAFVTMLGDRVYGPVGMATAHVGDDPRPVVDDFATGYAPDLAVGAAPEPYAPVGSYAPVGGALVSLADMANYATMQLNAGVSVDGVRVVSAANLAECWTAHVEMPYPRAEAPDLERLGYGMGWIDSTYRGSRRALSHSGGIDGFSSHILVLPEDNLGLVVLANVGPFPSGQFFTSHLPNLLLNARFGINRGLLDAEVAGYRDAVQHLDDLAAQAGPVDAATIAPWLGHYERGWSLSFDAAGDARLRQGARSFRLLAMPDGSYVMAGGILPGNPVYATRDANDAPRLEIEGFETVRWTVGGEW